MFDNAMIPLGVMPFLMIGSVTMMRALDLAEAVDGGELSPSAIAELCLEAIAERDAAIKAMVSFDADLVRLAASRNRAMGGLYGLPVGVKDIIDTATLPTQHGSVLYQGNQPRSDAAIVSIIEAEAGVILGKTATTEFAFLDPAPTFNPFDSERTPGGSSAGSAAGVAAGMMPLALGTQTGGSVIRPASFCGVAAIKPSYRLLPMAGVKPFAPLLDTLGIFGARVIDVAFALEALSKRPARVDGQDFGTPRFGVWRMSFAGEVEAESIAALDSAIKALENAGAQVAALPEPVVFEQAQAAHRIINNVEGAQSLAYEHCHRRDALSSILLEALDHGAAQPMSAYDEARRIGNHARKAMDVLMADVDVILTYSARGIAPGRESTGDAAFNKLFTFLGMPAINVPFFKGEGGMPVGVQVVGAFGDDRRALAAAAFLEALKES